ncbi:TPA: hypothetical protein PXN07_004018 [Yersinia enterocolitica]|uniref:hypothetical protein n=1 Tax=Yersinia sp. LJYL362 TaxID=3402108 RepID=UPI0028B2A3A6|nr:hypothetical protein [Yersinia enterocolitica]ELI7916206.1 hypothetical protein [Yersinia enterocolitica]ELI7928866.1 hypothetical protein [Yersinia enterocolitica]ELI7961079.1 hypothetical protein [Yersinia enterocolitica]ELI8142474.1 hypothetical protein [Yersinia enterocolitica]
MLAHPFSNAMIDYLSRPNVIPITAVRLDLVSGVVCAHTGVGPIVIGGETYLGVGIFAQIDEVTEQNGTSPSQLQIQVSGFETALLSTFTNERCRGRAVKVILAAMEDDGSIGVADLIYSGEIASANIEAGNKNIISILVTNRFERWQMALPNRFNEESHLVRAPGDHFFRYVAQMADRAIYWGSKKDAPVFVYK